MFDYANNNYTVSCAYTQLAEFSSINYVIKLPLTMYTIA